MLGQMSSWYTSEATLVIGVTKFKVKDNNAIMYSVMYSGTTLNAKHLYKYHTSVFCCTSEYPFTHDIYLRELSVQG